MEKNILFVGSHPDDIELGCLGSILHYTKNGNANVYCIIASDGEGGNTDARMFDRVDEGVRCLVSAGVKSDNISFLHLPDKQLELHTIKIIDAVENICKEKNINWVFLQTDQDTHQDHRAVYHATLSAVRNVDNVLVYESNSSTTPVFTPNYFFDISPYVKEKTDLLTHHHKSQMDRHYMKVDSVVGLARYRGEQSRKMPYAEAFEVFRITERLKETKD
jgi:LmbE family N-acetylglucosaminyl deacetylase